MDTKQKIYNLIILDESGSMTSIKKLIISGFNEVVQTIKGVAKQYPEQEHYISFISFNSLNITTHLDCELTTALKELTVNSYRPSASTPLFDAMGEAINHLRRKIKDEKQYNVLVTILTDGMENASKEYDKTAIKALVEETEDENWTFTYIGTDHDVEKFAVSISIKNTMSFSKNQEGLKSMFAEERVSRERFSKRIREKKNTKDNYYDED